jgi:SAM-dependent methyltransferase
MTESELRESWNRVTHHYQSRHALWNGVAHYGVRAPGEDHLRLLGDLRGRHVLELGCGGGQCCLDFARRGAECIGVDLADAQIAHARDLLAYEQSQMPGDALSVTFHRAEMLEFLRRQPEGTFDLVFSAYAFSYVDALAEVFHECRRVLRSPQGLLVFSLDHPFSERTVCEDGKVLLEGSYFDQGGEAWEWEHGAAERTPLYSYRRTLSTYVRLLAEAGFHIERMEEPEPTEEFSEWASEADRERFRCLPATIIWKARACGEGGASRC